MTRKEFIDLCKSCQKPVLKCSHKPFGKIILESETPIYWNGRGFKERFVVYESHNWDAKKSKELYFTLKKRYERWFYSLY